MTKLYALFLVGGLAIPSISSAIDLKQAKFTQVVNSVEIISAADKSRHTAAVNSVFKVPDIVRTGPNSRAELVSEDNTITRVGANTIFSYDTANRTIDLQQGSLLFHSNPGKGGGTIHTGSATASVLGTTIVVTSTPNGGFKLLVLEGEAEIRFLTGQHLTLSPGQMTFILPGGGTSPVVVFRLDSQTKGSDLVSGFTTPLPSIGKISAEVTRQLMLILNNQAVDTGLGVGNNGTPSTVQVQPDQQTLGNLQPAQNPSVNASIIGTDHTPNQPLPVNYPSFDSSHLQKVPFEAPAGESISQGLGMLGIINNQPSAGFVADNIDIDTARVDLSPYAASPDFDFIATGNLKIWQSVNFTPPAETITGPSAPDTISLMAGGEILIAPVGDGPTVLEANTSIFGLVADSFGMFNASDNTVTYQNTLEHVSVVNNVGDVDILSLQDLNIYNSSFNARGIVNIESQNGSLNLGSYDDDTINAGSDVYLSTGILTGGDLTVDHTTINAGFFNGDVSDSGGSLNLSADNGDLNTYAANLNAYSGSVGVGDVSIYAGGNVDLEDTSVYGDGDVNIESGNTLTLNTGGTTDSVEAGGNVYLTSDNADVDVNNYSIYADNGSVSIGGEGSVYLSGNDIESGYDTSTAYNVDINSYGSTIDIEGTYISATGDVNIESSDTLYLGYNGTSSDNNEIDAGGSIYLTADYGDAYVYDYSAYADGDINITSGGTISESSNASAYGGSVYVEYSDIEAGRNYGYSANGGNVNINAYNGDVTLYEDYIFAYSGEESSVSGNINIYAGGNIDFTHSDVYQAGSVTATANYGYVNIYDVYNDSYDYNSSDTYLTDWTISAGSYVDIGADGSIQIYNSDIYAGGNVDITSEGSVEGGGSIDIEYSYNIYAGYSGSTGGSVSITANDGTVYMYDDEVYAYSGENTSTGDVNISSSGTTDIEYTYIYADGNVSIDSGDTLYLGWYDGGSTIDAYGGGGVSLTSDNGDIYSYGYDINAYNGDVDVTALNGVIDIEDTYINAGGDVVIESGDTLYLGYNYGYYGNNKIKSYGGVSLTSDYADIYVSDYRIYANGGSVYMTASSGAIDIQDSYITASDDINIDSGCTLTLNNSGTSSYDTTLDAGDSVFLTSDYADVDVNGYDINANGGSAEVTAYKGGIDIENTYINANTDVNIESGDTLYLGWNDGGLTIDAGTYVSLKSDNADVDVSGYNINAYNNDVTISAPNGGISVEDTYIQAYNGVTLSAGDGGVYLDYADLNADNGDISISATGDGTIYTDYGYISAYGSVTMTAGGDININYTPVSATTSYVPDGSSYSQDEVSISSGGKLTVNGTYGDNSFGYDIGADNKIILWGANGVSLDDVYAETLSGCYYDQIGITADGKICIMDGSYLDTSGSVNVESYDGGVSIIGGSGIYAGGGDAYVSADNGMLEVNSDHDFSGVDNADIYASGTVTLDGNCVGIYDTAIDASSGAVYVTSSDGNVILNDVNIQTGSTSEDVDITANYGNLTMESGSAGYGIYISAGGAVNLSADGDVTILGNTTSLGDNSAGDYVYADGGDVTIQSGQTISFDGGSGGTTSLHVENMYVEADGSVYVTAYGGGVFLKGDQIYADGNSDSGDVAITAYGSTADLENTYISAAGNVTIESCDTLTLGYCTGDQIDAGGNVSLTSDNADVDVYDSTIGYNNQIGGNINITAYNGAVDLENDYINAYGNVTIESGCTLTLGYYTGDQIDAGGNVSLTSDNADVDVYDSAIGYINPIGGNVTVSALYGGIDLESDTINTLGYVDVEAGGGMLTVNFNQDFTQTADITAGGYVTLDGNCVGIYDAAISAGGPVTITAKDGNVIANDVNIQTSSTSDVNVTANSGDLTMESGDAGYGVYISASGAVNLSADGDVTILGGEGAGYVYAGAGDVTIQSGGAISFGYLGTASGSVDVENMSTIEAYDSVYVYAHGGDIILNNDNITADNGELAITAFNSTADLENTTISAYGNITIESSDTLTLNNTGSASISAGGTVSLTSDNSDVDVTGYTIGTADAPVGGDVDVTATSGVIDIEGSAVNADGNVTIESGGTLTLGSSTSDSITAGLGVYLTSDNSDVDVYGSTITANGGDVDITSGGASVLYHDSGYGDIDVEHSTLTTGSIAGGNVDLSANGAVTLLDDSISANGAVNVEADNLDVDISSDSSTAVSSISGLTGVTITSDYGAVNITDTAIASGNGDVNISAENAITIEEDSSSHSISGNNVNLTTFGGQGISVSGATITGTAGNVIISAFDENNKPDFVGHAARITPSDLGGSVSIISAPVGNIGSISIIPAVPSSDPALTIVGTPDIDIEGSSTIEQPGSVILDAPDWVYLSDPTLTSDYGDVTVTAGAGYLDGYYTTISADGGNATITAGDYIDVENSTIYANNGVDIASFNGSTYLSSDNITANDGDVSIVSYNSTVDLENTYVSASGDVNIESDGTLTLGYGYFTGDNIDSGGSVLLKSDSSDVDIYGSSIGETGINDYYSPIGGTVNIEAYNGSIDMEGTYLEADGTVTLEAGANLFFYEDEIYSDYGDINITSDGSISESTVGTVSGIDIEYSDIEAYGSVNIYADNGGYNGNIYTYSDTITADYGDVNIQSYSSSTIDMEYSYISAPGGVNIESGGTLTLGNYRGDAIDSNGNVLLKSDNSDVDIYDSYIGETGVYDYYSPIGGTVDIEAYNGSIDMENTHLEADGTVTLEAGANLYLYEDEIYSDYGDVYITSDGSISESPVGTVSGIDIEYSDIEASGSVYIYANNVGYNDDVYTFGDTITADYGDVNIHTYSSSTIDLEDTSITADYGYITIESGGTLTLGNDGSYNNNIISAGYDIYLTSDNGDVDAYNYTFNAYDGNVSFYTYYGAVDIEDSTINASSDSNVSLTGDTITATGNVDLYGSGGDVSIEGIFGGVTILGTTIDLGGNVTVSGSSLVSTGPGNVDISTSGGSFTVIGFGIDINTANNFSGNNILVELGSHITTDDGNVNINDYGTFDAEWASTFAGINNSSINLGSVEVSGSTITANGGNVNITTEGSVYLPSIGSSTVHVNDISIDNSTISAYAAPVVVDGSGPGDVTLNAGGNVFVSGSTIYADDTVTITAGGQEQGTSDYGNVDIENSSITAGTAVNVTANGYVYDSGITLDLAGWDVLAGDYVELTASGDVTVNGGSLTADGGDVDIYGGTGFETGNLTISTSGAGGKVDITGGSLTSPSGYVNISAGAGIVLDSTGLNIEGTGTGGDVNITSSSSISASGGVDINAGNGFTLDSGSLNETGPGTGGTVDISGSTLTVSGGDVDIYGGTGMMLGSSALNETGTGTGGGVDISTGSSISASGNVYIYGGDGISLGSSAINESASGTGGSVDVSSSTITASGGDVDIYGGSGLIIGDGLNEAGSGVGGNVDITTASTISASGDVNIDTYQDGTVDVEDSSITAAGTVDIVSSGTLTTGTSSTISATTGDVDLTSTLGDISAQNTTLNAAPSTGNVNVTAYNGAITLTGDSLTGVNSVNVSSGNDLTVNGGSINSDNTSYGDVTLGSSSGQTTIKGGASVTSFYLNVNSSDGILIDGTSGGTLKGNTMNLTASSTLGVGKGVTVQNEDLSQLANVNIAAHTVNMDGVNFSSASSYNLTVFYHDFYINNGHQAGYANFNNDTLDGATILNQQTTTTLHPLNNGGIVLGGTGVGIHVN